MIRNAEETLHKEQKKLRILKQQFVRFRGDLDWAPVGDMHTEYDDWLLASVFDGTPLAQVQNGDHTEPTEALAWEGAPKDGTEQGEDSIEDVTEAQDTSTHDIEMTGADDQPTMQDTAEKDEPSESQIEKNSSQQNGDGAVPPASETNGNPPSTTDQALVPSEPTSGPATIIPDSMIVQVPSSPTIQRMTTRALATALPAGDDEHPAAVHPFFIHPPPQLPIHPSPDDDPLGTLLAYTSKQQEVVRLWETLLLGLLKAKRLRNEVMRWCKAEAHVGEMSDGEDWVDLEEWGLHDDELKKGRDEEENEVVEATGRRGRRGGRGGAAGAAGGERG